MAMGAGPKLASATKASWLERHRKTCEGSALAIALTEGEAHVVRYANAALAELTRTSSDALPGARISHLFAAPGALGPMLDRVYTTGVTDIVYDVVAGGVSDAERCVAVVAHSIADERGRRRGLVVQVVESHSPMAPSPLDLDAKLLQDLKDANERLIVAGLREQELADKATRHAGEVTALLQNMTEGVTVFDAEGHIVLVNATGRAMLGFKSENVSLDHYRRCDFRRADGSPLDFEGQVLSRMLRGEAFREEEVVFRTPAGVERQLVWGASAVRDARGEVSLAIKVYRDVTDARELAQLREQDISLISHDLRAPLSAARMAAHLIASDPSCGERQQGYVKLIVKSLNRQDRMLADLLDVFRIRARERLSLQLDECDLTAIVQDVVDELKAVHGDRFVLVGERTLRGVWSRQELHRAISNLASNAVKYGARDAPVVLSVARTMRGAAVAVHNDGPAIPPEDLARLFVPFTRSKAATAARVHGWGLGLTLVRGCAEAHGGKVSVESDDATGTTFTLELPLDAWPYQIG